MIKNFYKYTMLVACAAMTFASCSSDDEVVAPGEWDSSVDYAMVSFLERTKTFELDPTDTTVVTLHLTRRNPELTKMLEAEEERVNKLLEDTTQTKTAADSARIDSLYNVFVTTNSNKNLPAIEVPITITNGMDSVFTVSTAKFAEGEWDAEYTLSFDSAKVGTPYEVQLAVQDTRFVSSYSSECSATVNVTRVKWVPAGFVYDDNGNKVPGYAEYTDNLVGFLYGAGNRTFEVELQEREDKPGMYRMVSPYKNYQYVAAGIADWTGPDYYMVFDATDPAKVSFAESTYDLGFTFDAVEDGNPIIFCRGYGTLENGALTFPAQAFYLGLSVYTGGDPNWYANPDGAFLLIIDPDEYAANTKYEATLEDDFDWEEVFSGPFTSERSDAAATSALYRGVCTTTTDACDSIFEAKYGTPYLLSSPYAEGYDLLFFVKNGRLSLHADFKEDYTYQEIGRTDGLNPIYARINNSDCSFSDDEVILNITFVTLGFDAKTNSIYEAINYGTVEDKLTRAAESEEESGGEEVKKFIPRKAPGKVVMRKDFRSVVLPARNIK